MSTFQCPVVRVTVHSHPDADALEIAEVGGYKCVVRKDAFRSGDLAVYLPEDAVLPEWLLKLLGFWDAMNNKGTLTTSAGNRIRAVKLRGVVSQGVLYPLKNNEGHWLLHVDKEEGFQHSAVTEGQDCAEFLGVTKYEVPIPQHLAGRVARGGGDLEACFLYDFENIKARPNLFMEEEPVVITEKLHGTQFQCGLIPQRIWEGKPWAEKAPNIGGSHRGTVTSKGLSKQGLLLDPEDLSNVYVKTAHDWQLWQVLLGIKFEMGIREDEPIFIFGEIYGAGLQKGYTYGHANHPNFRAFDIAVGDRNTGKFLPYGSFMSLCEQFNIPTVPVLYDGKFSMSVVKEHTDGLTTLGGEHIREGVVVKCKNEIYDRRYGRRIVKSVSDAYLLKQNKSGTDYQ